jgi:nitroreductase
MYDTLKQRRAIKHYDPEHRLTSEELRALISAAALAPSSFNMQNRHFGAVVDLDQKLALQGAAWGQEQVRDASAVFVITGSLVAHRNTDRYLRNAPAEARGGLEPMIAKMYEGNEQLLRDEACRSVGLSAMALMLMATSMGYASGPMIGFDPGKVSEIVGLDDDHPPLMLVVVGRGTKPAHPRLGLLNLEEVGSVDRFGNAAIKGEIEG